MTAGHPTSPRRREALYPRFSDAEMANRRRRASALMAERGLAGLVVHGRRGSSAVPWLTGWQVTTEAVAILLPDGEVRLLVQLYNHVPNARILAADCQVEWAGPDTLRRVVSDVSARVERGSLIGWIGDLSHRAAVMLGDAQRHVVDLSEDYTQLRLVKSPEELEWIRRGASLTDRSLDALVTSAQVGVSELELVSAVEASYLGEGGTNHLHFIASTPMQRPERCVPAQWPSHRRLQTGDVVITELSTSFWGYPGQLLRTIAIATEPSALYRELHEVASATFAEVARRVRAGTPAYELVAAADLVEESGYSIYDDLLHGFGGGYLPPVLRTRGSQREPIPDMRLKAGMTIVVQPNVITTDGRAGVQTGELLVVTEDGYEQVHSASRGFLAAEAR